MLPLLAEIPNQYVLLISGAIAVLVPGAITLAVKLVEIRAKKREAKDNAPVVDATVDKTKVETNSVEADVWTKALQGQGTVVQQLLNENARAYDRAKEAEDKATAANKTADAAKADAATAREEVANLRKDMEHFQDEQRAFELKIEGYFVARKIPFPEWWPRRHDTDGSDNQS